MVYALQASTKLHGEIDFKATFSGGDEGRKTSEPYI